MLDVNFIYDTAKQQNKFFCFFKQSNLVLSSNWKWHLETILAILTLVDLLFLFSHIFFIYIFYILLKILIFNNFCYNDRHYILKFKKIERNAAQEHSHL